MEKREQCWASSQEVTALDTIRVSDDHGGCEGFVTEVGKVGEGSVGTCADGCPVCGHIRAAGQQNAAHLPVICAGGNWKHMAPHNGSSVVL